MANIFKDIADTVKKVFGGKTTDADIKASLEDFKKSCVDILRSLPAFEEVFNSKAMNTIRETVIADYSKGNKEAFLSKYKDENFYIFVHQYVTSYEKSIRLNHGKPSSFLGSLIDMLPRAKDDIENIVKHFDDIFGEYTTQNDQRVSHQLTMAYVNTVDDLMYTLTSFLSLLPMAGSVSKEITTYNPRRPYHPVNGVSERFTILAAFVANASKDRMDFYDRVIKPVRSESKDFLLKTPEGSLDDMASSQMYSPEMLALLQHGFLPNVLNPVYWVVAGNLAYSEWRHKIRSSNVAFIEARLQVLEMELQGVDTSSPEYKRKVQTMNNYRAILDTTQREIEKYER